MNFLLLLNIINNSVSSTLLQASTGEGVITVRCIFMLSAFAILVAGAFFLSGYAKNKKVDNNRGDNSNLPRT